MNLFNSRFDLTLTSPDARIAGSKSLAEVR